MFRNLVLSGALLLSSAALANQPDLSIETIVAFSGNDVEVQVHVYNLGDAASDAAWVDLYGSKGAQWAGDDQNTHYDYRMNALNPGEYDKVVFFLTSQEWENNGTVYATVDVDLAVAESDETNNMARLVIMDANPNEPVLACGTSSLVFAPLNNAVYMSANFLQTNVPFYFCKSRVL